MMKTVEEILREALEFCEAPGEGLPLSSLSVDAREVIKIAIDRADRNITPESLCHVHVDSVCVASARIGLDPVSGREVK